MKKRICILLTAALVVSLIAMLIPAVAAVRTPVAGDVDLQQPGDEDLPAETETTNSVPYEDCFDKEPNFWYLYGNESSEDADLSDTEEVGEISALQAAVNQVVGGNGVVALTLAPGAVTDDRIVVPFDRNITIDYNGQYMEASFNRGVTYRDADGNLHYYSDPAMLFADEDLDMDVCCLWGDFSNFREGKYLIRPCNGENVFEFDPDTGDCTAFTAGVYIFTWAGDADAYFLAITAPADVSAD